MNIDAIAAIFDAKLSGNGYMALCPSHPDRNRSLSISEGNAGRVLIHCFAGCETTDVLAAKGLTMADLMPSSPERTSNTLGSVVASYQYTDEDNKLLYEVQRYVPKTLPPAAA